MADADVEGRSSPDYLKTLVEDETARQSCRLQRPRLRRAMRRDCSLM